MHPHILPPGGIPPGGRIPGQNPALRHPFIHLMFLSHFVVSFLYLSQEAEGRGGWEGETPIGGRQCRHLPATLGKTPQSHLIKAAEIGGNDRTPSLPHSLPPSLLPPPSFPSTSSPAGSGRKSDQNRNWTDAEPIHWIGSNGKRPVQNPGGWFESKILKTTLESIQIERSMNPHTGGEG